MYRQIELIATGLTSGVTLEDLDDFFDSLDDVSPSLDSPYWKGGNETLLGFNSSFKLGSFAGTPTIATIESQEVELSPGNRTLIRGIKPLVGGIETITVSLGTRDGLADEVDYGDAVTPTARTGMADFRKETRYARARVTMNGPFEFAKGLQYDATETGPA